MRIRRTLVQQSHHMGCAWYGLIILKNLEYQTMMKTYSAKAADLDPKWYIIAAEGQVLGRLASQIAQILRGTHEPTFTPHLQGGAAVIVVIAEEVAVLGRRCDEMGYYRH